jgi:hypothetical protein
MREKYIKWLRGDAMREAINIYNHIDPEDVRKSYLAHIPHFGVEKTASLIALRCRNSISNFDLLITMKYKMRMTGKLES